MNNHSGFDKATITQLIKSKTIELGFDACGIAKAEKLSEEESRLKNWLDKGFNGRMDYMSNYFEKRLDPTLLVEESKSVIVVLFYYYPPVLQNEASGYKISKYAFGRDYQSVIRGKLNQLGEYINEIAPGHTWRAFSDSAPVREKAWAVKAGLGSIGKHSLLLVPGKGSFFFIGELITSLELEYDQPFKANLCGACTRCMNACPNGAIAEPSIIDARKCIAHQTIESKEGKFSESVTDNNREWIFGCDICQDACPWNKKVQPHTHEDFLPNLELLALTKPDWESMTEERFNEIFKDSGIKRTKFDGLKRNIDFLKNK
jgi:epoxyqueuosine reductase